jgi:hypothetical protein
MQWISHTENIDEAEDRSDEERRLPDVNIGY